MMETCVVKAISNVCHFNSKPILKTYTGRLRNRADGNMQAPERARCIKRHVPPQPVSTMDGLHTTTRQIRRERSLHAMCCTRREKNQRGASPSSSTAKGLAGSVMTRLQPGSSALQHAGIPAARHTGGPPCRHPWLPVCRAPLPLQHAGRPVFGHFAAPHSLACRRAGCAPVWCTRRTGTPVCLAAAQPCMPALRQSRCPVARRAHTSR